MDAIEIALLLQEVTPSVVIVPAKVDAPTITQEGKITRLPMLYALSKTGSVRSYEVLVREEKNQAVVVTRKKVTLDGKWVEDEYPYTTGVNIGKANETTYLEQALRDAQSIWKKQLDAGFSTTMPKAGEKFNTDASGNMKPMLAHGFNAKLIKFPCIGQPKYDGVRCLTFLNGSGEVKINSRKGKPYNIPHLKKWAEEHKELLPLDGELYNHKELTFQEIVSAVKKHSEITSKIRYVVYDRPVGDIPNGQRWENTQLMLSDLTPSDPVYLSGSRVLHNMDEAWEYHKECTDAGYEGIILRNMEGVYEFGFRSNDLIKLKTFDDSEFEIIGVVEATGRDEGTAIFVCKCKGGEFNVKPQGSRELRAEYFERAKELIGKMVTVKYQGLSDEGIPRFPSAISVRDYE